MIGFVRPLTRARGFSLGLVAVAAVLSLSACGRQKEDAPPPVTLALLAPEPGSLRPGEGFMMRAGQWPQDGEAIFRRTCALCHTTGVGPELRGRQLPPEATEMLVRYGGTAMPAFRKVDIDDAALGRLATWLEKSEAPSRPPAPEGKP